MLRNASARNMRAEYGKITNGVIGWKCNGNLCLRKHYGKLTAPMDSMGSVRLVCNLRWRLLVQPVGMDTIRGRQVVTTTCAASRQCRKDYVCPNHWYKLPSLSIKPNLSCTMVLPTTCGGLFPRMQAAEAKAGHSYPPTWSMHSYGRMGWRDVQAVAVLLQRDSPAREARADSRMSAMHADG